MNKIVKLKPPIPASISREFAAQLFSDFAELEPHDVKVFSTILVNFTDEEIDGFKENLKLIRQLIRYHLKENY